MSLDLGREAGCLTGPYQLAGWGASDGIEKTKVPCWGCNEVLGNWPPAWL